MVMWLFKATKAPGQSSMFAAVVPVEGHMRGNAFVAPHVAHRRKRAPQAGPVLDVPADTRLPYADLFDPIARAAAPAEPLAIRHPQPLAAGMPDLASYDTILVMFSGGKDSVAAVLTLLEQGAPRERIELWHHDIDGGGQTLMDWPITPAYCRAVARALGMPIFFSYREGGFEREMNRDQAQTAPVVFETPDGEGRAGGTSGKLGTRQRFPQVSADLSTRWCSGALKVDVGAAAIRNQQRFLGKRTLVVTGERAQESANRARYRIFEHDRTHTQSRHVDHLRPIHAWSEAEVWAAIRRNGIVPHPAYQLGYGRLSCRHCIFASADQLATNRALYPESFARIAGYEQAFNSTIHRTETVDQRADKGEAYAAATAQPELAALADARDWTGPVLVDPAAWQMPAGALSRDRAGPT